MIKHIKNFFNTNISFLLLLIAVVFVLYGKSINFKLTSFDDDTLTVKNINLISNYKNIPKLFIMSAFYDNYTPYYRPVLSLSFAIESFFFRDNLKFYHLTNIILFILSLYLFYLFCLLLKLNVIILKAVLLILTVHPMFSSVVVWIPGRNESLLTVFFISSFIFFIKYAETEKIKYAFLFGIFFVLSLFTKETFIMLIPLYFVYLYFFKYKILKKKLLFVFISLIPFFLIYFILRNCSIAYFSYEYYVSNINISFINFTKDCFIYFYNFFVPENIPIMLFNADLNLKIIVYNSLFALILIFLLYKKILIKRLFVFSISIVFLSLFPTFLQEENLYLNHRFFIPSVGFIIIIVSILDCLFSKFDKMKKFLKFIFITVFICYFSYCFAFSYNQANKYKDYENFWVNSYIYAPNYYAACQNLSKIYLERGMFEEAKYYVKKAVFLKSSYETFINYANFLMAIEDYNQAEEALLKMEKEARGNKNLLYYLLSKIYYQKKNYEKALDYALKAYNIAPYYTDYCKNLIKVYDVINNYDEELKIYKQLLDFDKNNKDYKNKIKELEEKINNKRKTNA